MINEWKLLGSVGREPVLSSYGNDGRQMMRFSVATNKRYQDRAGEWKTKTSWHSITLFGGHAKRAYEKGLAKGDLVFLSGEMGDANWEKDGQKHYGHQLDVDLFLILEQKNGGAPKNGGGWGDNQTQENSGGWGQGTATPAKTEGWGQGGSTRSLPDDDSLPF